MDNIKLHYQGGLEFVAETPSGHQITMDGAPDFGGGNKGPRPMELVLVALGGCSGMDIASILNKKRMDLKGIEINVKGEKAPEYPKKYTDVEIEFIVKGKNLTDEAVGRAVELSMQKYCSVKATIEGTAKVKYSYKIVNE